jgi:ABC-type Fe3+-hydroxamate transport system, periplasmic component
MRKIATAAVFLVSLLITGCQMGESTTTNFSFGDDLVFIQTKEHIRIDLEKSSELVREKHQHLSEILIDTQVLNDIAATTTTTANILHAAGLPVIAAPESNNLDSEITKQQYALSENQGIDRSKVLNVGSALSPNIEALMELEPELVLYSDALPHAQYIATLQEFGINIHALPQSDYLDMFILLDVLGVLHEHQHAGVDALFQDMVEALKRVQVIIDAQDGNLQQSVAILQVSERGMIANNDEAVLGRIVTALGLQNAFRNSANAEVGKEVLLGENPDYIIFYTHGDAQGTLEQFHEEIYGDDSIYRELDAVKNGKVFAVSSDDFTFAASVDLDVIHVIEFLAERFYE